VSRDFGVFVQSLTFHISYVNKGLVLCGGHTNACHFVV